MRLGLRQNADTGEMQLINVASGEVVENLAVTHAETQPIHADHFGMYGSPVYRTLIGYRIIMTVEVLNSFEHVFEVTMYEPGQEPRSVPISEAIRVIRFPRKG